jgi:Ca-activated chloride channel family protein
VERLLELVERERERESGVSLTTLGFGTGNYNEHLMERIADAGDGNYAYVDSRKEANRVLVRQMAGTLGTIAKDVKIQIEFNPAVVAEYRLIGYENRALAREDFNDDRVDAGEIGVGHSVTALYEIALVGGEGGRVDPLRYGNAEAPSRPAPSGELAYLKVRYKAPGAAESRRLEWAIPAASVESVEGADPDFRFAAAVAGFGELLRGGRYVERFGFADIERLARGARGADPHGDRGEFLQLVALARSLSPPEPVARSE